MSEEETFKVTDRRRGHGDAAAPSPAAPAPSLSPTSPEPRVSPEPVPPDPVASEPDLQGLLVMFASSALVGLGAAPDPMTGEERIDLDQAQEAIETLLLLRVKTEGNRTEAESSLLEEILYDLQVRFVRLAEGGGGAAR